MTYSSNSPPRNLQELHDIIGTRKLRFSKQHTIILRHAFEMPTDVALGTTQSLAENCKVSAASVSRLSRFLGFEKYAEFRNLFRQSLRDVSDKSQVKPSSQKTF